MGTRISHIQHHFQVDIRSMQQSNRLSITPSGVTTKQTYNNKHAIYKTLWETCI